MEQFRQVGFDGKGRYKKATAVVPNNGRHKEAGNFKVLINQAGTVLDQWEYEIGGFPKDVRVGISICKALWRRLDMLKKLILRQIKSCVDYPLLQLHYQKTLKHLKRYEQRFPRWKWDIFENVVRWNEPTGVPGSKISVINHSSIEAARNVVLEVASGIK